MRLINARTLEFEEFYGQAVPGYAILSPSTLQDWQDLSAASRKSGFTKIRRVCEQAIQDSLDYVWIDTNCIDKTSSAELSEAINSMFAWYRNTRVCYVYLEDVVEPEGSINITTTSFASRRVLQGCRWFTRGWTLQELLASESCLFFTKQWKLLGTKKTLEDILFRITGIEVEYFRSAHSILSASIARRMAWMSKRTTTRIEDMAYCMLGIFDINMPLLYGESSKAFLRLQEEIIKVPGDQTIFCWSWNSSVPRDWHIILAPSPAAFESCGDFCPKDIRLEVHMESTQYSLTNIGLLIKLPTLLGLVGVYYVLNVYRSINIVSETSYHDWMETKSRAFFINLTTGALHQRQHVPPTPFDSEKVHSYLGSPPDRCIFKPE